MVQILIAAMLFPGLINVASADLQNASATVKNAQTVASQTVRVVPVAGHRATANPKPMAEKYAAILKDLRPLAEQGNAEAQYKLGLMYFRGEGVPQNYIAACMWLFLANAGATGDFGADTMKARFEVETMIPPDAVNHAQQLAIEWQKKRTPNMPTPSKEELLDTFAKVQACIDAGYMKEAKIEKDISPRVEYYARLFFTEWDIDKIGASIPDREKKAVTIFGWGCRSAYAKLLALPLPGESAK